MKKYESEIFDQERALYAIREAIITNCRFEGDADGESALKETENIEVINSVFKLRYPFWHTTNAKLKKIEMTDTCRAALWYDENISITDSFLGGIKALRECKDISIENCNISSTEFAWFCDDISIANSKLSSEYQFLKSKNINITNLEMSGKYSFQYCENVEIKNSILDTKDAFWHCKNITVCDSVVKGEYLGWYSENLTLKNCKIIGTQPLCYAKNTIIENSEMIDCDLSFEKSSINVCVNGEITSVKNPLSGYIEADSIKEYINENNSICKIIIRR